MTINNPISVLDGVCYSFTVSNSKFVLLQPNGGFNKLSPNDNNKTVPYLARNISQNNDQWEIGLGKLEIDNGIISLSRAKVTTSSSNNQIVQFSNFGNTQLYILANQYNFNTGFQNVILKNSNFTVDNIQSIYLIDNSNAEITINLIEPEGNQNLVLQFKLLYPDSPYKVNVKKSTERFWLTLDNNKTYSSIVCSGSDWVELNDGTKPTVAPQPESSEENKIVLQAVAGSGLPGGDLNSLQFNSSGSFDGVPVYYVDNKILVGASGVSQANTIIPISTGNLVINNKNYGSDFIVKGSGDKNLYFASEGRLGINMPSGQKPATALHVVNNTCLEGIRLENRNQCYPANLTLYHKPSTISPSGTTIGTINLAGKNSVASQVNYVQLKSRILNSTIGQTSGEFIVSVENAGSLVDVLNISHNRFRAQIGSNAFDLSPSGLDITGQVNLRNFDIDGGVIVFGGLSSDNSPSTSPTPTPTITVTSSLTPTPTPTLTPTPSQA